MQKAKKYDWKDSNMALFGSDTEKKVKKESAESEPAWKCAGEKVGLQIWRIVKFKVMSWPSEQYGEFYSGDSYIILNTYKEEDEIKYDVHFWIGKYSTQDEYGTAAYKTVELDTFLEDKPIQHREVQAHESDLFKSYFDCLKLLKGGADTGFKRVLPEVYVPRLLHVKRESRKKICIMEEKMLRANLNEDDVFIIDCGLSIYQYNGAHCTHDEKYKAGSEVSHIISHRTKARKHVIDSSCSPDHHALKLLQPGEKKGGEKQCPCGQREMFVVSDEDGSLDMDKIEGELCLKNLNDNDVFIINSGTHVFCWVGKGASVDERKNGLTYASNYLNGTETPWLPISVIAQGKENKCFHEVFH